MQTMMTPEQRYLFDASGYLHLENALSPAELKAAQDAVQCYVDTPAASRTSSNGTASR